MMINKVINVIGYFNVWNWLIKFIGICIIGWIVFKISCFKLRMIVILLMVIMNKMIMISEKKWMIKKFFLFFMLYVLFIVICKVLIFWLVDYKVVKVEMDSKLFEFCVKRFLIVGLINW